MAVCQPVSNTVPILLLLTIVLFKVLFCLASAFTLSAKRDLYLQGRREREGERKSPLLQNLPCRLTLAAEAVLEEPSESDCTRSLETGETFLTYRKLSGNSPNSRALYSSCYGDSHVIMALRQRHSRASRSRGKPGEPERENHSSHKAEPQRRTPTTYLVIVTVIGDTP